MSASAILRIDVACPNCGRMNSLTLGDMDASKIACSACRNMLGTGRELAACRPRPAHRPARQNEAHVV